MQSLSIPIGVVKTCSCGGALAILASMQEVQMVREDGKEELRSSLPRESETCKHKHKPFFDPELEGATIVSGWMEPKDLIDSDNWDVEAAQPIFRRLDAGKHNLLVMNNLVTDGHKHPSEVSD